MVRKLLFPLLGLCIVAAAVVASLTPGAWLQYPDPAPNYYSSLNAKETALQNQVTQSGASNPQELKDCALVLWENGKLEVAERYLRKLWADKSEQAPSAVYDPVFVRDGLYLADLLVDRGSFSAAGEAYARILTYDVEHLGDSDPRVARDFNNIGLCYFLAGQNGTDCELRKQCFDKALEQYLKAEAIFRSHTQCQAQLVYNLQNQAMAYSELGDHAKAKALNRSVESQLTAWHHGNI